MGRTPRPRALFPSGPRAGFGCRVLWSSARHREPASVARGSAHWTPPPRPVSALAQKPNGGGEEEPGGARATSESALPSAHRRARAACPSMRPLISLGVLGDGILRTLLCRPHPARRASDGSRNRFPRAQWPTAHHVSGNERETERATEDLSRRSCCRDPTERGLSRPLPFSRSRTMRGGAAFRRLPRGPTGNEVRGFCTEIELASAGFRRA